MQLSNISLAITRLGNGGFFAGAALDLDLLSGNQILDPRVTFTRASNATLVGPDGTIQYAPHNLLTHSEQFDNAAWTKTGTTVAANSTIAPDNTFTADAIVSTTLSFPRVEREVVVSSGTHAFSIFVRPGSVNFLHGTFEVASVNVLRFFANLATGATMVAVSAGAISGTATLIADANGFFRLAVVINVPVTGTYRLFVGPSDAFGSSSAVVGSSIYAWGAQLNVGTLQPYYPTTVKNLLGYTQEFDNAAWAKSNATVAPNSTAAPNGLMLADKLVESASNAQHLCQQIFVPTAGTKYTTSWRVKSAERSFVFVGFSGGGLATDCLLGVNLTTGFIVTTTGAPESTSVTSNGNGWYTVRITKTLPSATACASRVVVSTDGIAQVYAGDGTSGIYIWGAQLSDSASLDPYSYNPGAAPAAQAYYGPRFDYDPVTLAPKGLLIEEQRTNLLAYSSDFTDAIWIKGTGVSVTSTTSLAPDGTLTADELTVNGASQTIYQVVSVTAGTAYSCTAFVKLGSMLVSEYKVAIYNNTAAAFIAVDITPTEVVSSGAWTKISYVFTAPAGCTSVRWYPFRNSATISTKTIQLWGSQVEAGALPTSYIPTTTAAATRAADVAVMTGANFSSWYRQDEGTLFAETQVSGYSNASNPRLVALAGANSATERIEMFVAGGSPNYRAVIRTNGVDELLQNVVSAANIYEQNKWAIAYKTNDSVAFGRNGNNTDTFVNLPAINSLDFPHLSVLLNTSAA